MNLRTVLLSPTLMMEQNIFVIFAILTLTLVSAHFDDVIQGKQKTVHCIYIRLLLYGVNRSD